jgi:mono/diheme cytochrome c family protein
MKKSFLVIGCIAILSLVFAVYGQTAGQQGQSAPTADAVAAQKAIVSQYCATCHSDKAAATGADSARKINFDQLDIAHISKDADNETHCP